ncbi:MAG: hypothetical protein RL154_774 [Pseudomonadota bacterium]|jgi:multiple antibiotic resistance protein
MEATYQHFLLGILAVANNIPALGTFLAICEQLNKLERVKITSIATFSSFVIMTVSMLFGTDVLAFFGITVSAFQIAGGVLLCVSGMGMMDSNGGLKGSSGGYSQIISTAIVPVSMPLTTGAGTMSTVTLFAEIAHANNQMWVLFAAVCTMTVIIFLIFYFATSMLRVLGEIGLSVLIKVMGLFTLAIGVQFIVTGVTHIYVGLPH